MGRFQYERGAHNTSSRKRGISADDGNGTGNTAEAPATPQSKKKIKHHPLSSKKKNRVAPVKTPHAGTIPSSIRKESRAVFLSPTRDASDHSAVSSLSTTSSATKVKLSGGTEVEGEDIAAVQQVMARAFKHDKASQTSKQKHDKASQTSRQAHELGSQESRQSHEFFKEVLQFGGNTKLAKMVLKTH